MTAIYSVNARILWYVYVGKPHELSILVLYASLSSDSIDWL